MRVVAGIGSSNLTRVHLEMETADGPASVRVEAPPGHLVATVEAPASRPAGARSAAAPAVHRPGRARPGAAAVRPRPGVRGRPGPGGRPGNDRRGSPGGQAQPRRERVQVVDGPDELAEAAARAAVADLEAAVEAHGSATWVLAGGGTPAAAYRRLAAHDLRAGVEWDRVRVAMGDERCVPVTHPDSNWGLAARPARPRPRPRPPAGAPAGRAGRRGGRRRLPGGPGRPPRRRRWETPPGGRLAGDGEDGHCLSLFPGRPEVEVADRLVVAVHDSPKPPTGSA